MFDKCERDKNTEIEQRAFCYVVLTIQNVCNSYSRHFCKLSFQIIDLHGQYDTKQNTFTSQFIKYAALNKWKVVLLFASTHIAQTPSSLNFRKDKDLNDGRNSLESGWSQHTMTVTSRTQTFRYISLHIPAHTTSKTVYKKCC